ncbi:MAG TPA: proline racemase family protein [Vicinamibacterales bacterium]|jgi:trans-L-3-hydroxyproline dehydratase
MRQVLKTIDAHVGGQPLRLIVEGAPRPAGKTMAQKRDWMKRHADQLRRALVLEPRGHRDMCAAMLTEPVAAGSDAGVIFVQNDGYPPISGHGIVAVTTIAIEAGLMFAGGADTLRAAETRVVFDTPAGTVHARARLQARGDSQSVDSVVFTNVPSFVVSGGHSVRLGTRELRVDVAFGGMFYAIADTEAIGIPLTVSRLPELRRLGVEIRASINAAGDVAHPVDTHLSGIAGVIFTGPPQDPEAHLRNVTVFADGAVDRSPCATGTSAVMAVLEAMGLLQDDQAFVHESVIGTLHRGRVARRTQVGDYPAIVTEVEGAAWLTGEHTFFVNEDDPLKEGFVV